MSPMDNLNEEALSSLINLPVGSWESSDLLVARESLGMTQAELAAAIDYERTAIAKIERGDAAPRRVVELAVRYLIDRRPQGTRFEIRTPESPRFRPVGTAIGVNEAGFPGGTDVNVQLAPGPAIWLRLLPEFDTGRRWSPIELKKAATQNGFHLVQLIDGYASLGFVRDKDGFGVVGMTGDRSNTSAVSFAFETGEIWSIDTYIINAIKQQAPGTRPGLPYLEDRFKLAMHSFRIVLTLLGLRPQFRWVAGIEGIKDCGLYYPAPAGHYFHVPIPHGRSLSESVWATGSLGEIETPASALKPFFTKVFAAFNVDRPEYLDGLSNPN